MVKKVSMARSWHVEVITMVCELKKLKTKTATEKRKNAGTAPSAAFFQSLPWILHRKSSFTTARVTNQYEYYVS